MHLAEGKVGQQAVISMTCIAMATAGLFSFYSGDYIPMATQHMSASLSGY